MYIGKTEIIKQGAVLICCALMLSGTSGCSSSDERAGSDAAQGVEAHDDAVEASERYFGPVPDFKSPYAEEFKAAYRYTNTDLQRRILDDERITEQEIEELKSAVAECVLLHGREVEWGKREDHSYGFASGVPQPDSEEVNRILDEEFRTDLCQVVSTSGIVSLFWRVRANPDHEDVPTIVAACMVRSGLRPQGYTAKDYDEDTERIGEQLDDDPEFRGKFYRCNDDPLGLIGDGIGR